MPYDARVFRILIASPSDVEEERDVAARAIQEWNNLHSSTRNVVLLPVRWETHLSPEYGTRPQAVINRAIVDDCDLLVGIFWTRLGSPTGVADSGTIEEIERVAKAGKPAMIYFSNAGAAVDSIDTDQLRLVKEFKDRIKPIALIESYKSTVDFHDKFFRQLEVKVRELQGRHASGVGPVLNMKFLDIETRTLAGAESEKKIAIVTKVLNEPEKIVDEEIKLLFENAKKRIRFASAIPSLFVIQNSGSSGVQNLFVEMGVEVVEGAADVQTNPPANASYQRVYTIHDWDVIASGTSRAIPNLNFDFGDEIEEDHSFEWTSLQPQRSRLIKPGYWVIPSKASELHFTAKVFADSFAVPIELKAILKIDVEERHIEFASLIDGERQLRKSGSM